MHLACALVSDALQDNYDDAFLVTADSDLKLAIDLTRSVAPSRQVIVVAPPERYGYARDFEPDFSITKGWLRVALLPDRVTDASRKTIVTRPREFDPPAYMGSSNTFAQDR